MLASSGKDNLQYVAYAPPPKPATRNKIYKSQNFFSLVVLSVITGPFLKNIARLDTYLFPICFENYQITAFDSDVDVGFVWVEKLRGSVMLAEP